MSHAPALPALLLLAGAAAAQPEASQPDAAPPDPAPPVAAHSADPTLSLRRVPALDAGRQSTTAWNAGQHINTDRAWPAAHAPTWRLAITTTAYEQSLLQPIWELSRGPAQPALRVTSRRPTALADGGLQSPSTQPVAPQTETELYGSALVDAGSTEFQVYELSLYWPALDAGPVHLDLITGMRAVRADVADVPGQFADDPRFRPVPVVGTDIRWDLARGMYLSGTALHHAVETEADMLDLKAEAGITFNPKVGVAIGYQYLRSDVDVGPFDASLRQEGPFARLQIRF